MLFHSLNTTSINAKGSNQELLIYMYTYNMYIECIKLILCRKLMSIFLFFKHTTIASLICVTPVAFKRKVERHNIKFFRTMKKSIVQQIFTSPLIYCQNLNICSSKVCLQFKIYTREIIPTWKNQMYFLANSKTKTKNALYLFYHKSM